jgi:hypothetical protein
MNREPKAGPERTDTYQFNCKVSCIRVVRYIWYHVPTIWYRYIRNGSRYRPLNSLNSIDAILSHFFIKAEMREQEYKYKVPTAFAL